MPNIREENANAIASRARFGFRTRQVESVVTVGVVPDVLVKNNPDRLYLSLLLEGAFPVRVGRNGQVTTASGIPMALANDVIEFTPEHDGEGTGYERFAIANGGNSNVRIIETIRVAEVAGKTGG